MNAELHITDEVDKKILAPLSHIWRIQSHSFLINKLPEAFNKWLHIPEDKLDEIRHIFKLVLNAILLFDDIQDSSLHRRTQEASHCVYGVPLALNASIHSLFLVLDRLQNMEHPQAAVMYCKQMICYMRGQGMDIYFRDNHTCPSEDEYNQMAIDKYGTIVLILLWMKLFSSRDVKQELYELVERFAVYMTIRDDYYNLVKPEGLEENTRIKEFQHMKETHICEDLTEGKYIWPIIHAATTPEAEEILDILHQRTRDAKVKRKCLSLLQRAGSLQQTRDVLSDLEAELRDRIKSLGGNSLFETLLDELAEWRNCEDLSFQ